MRPIHGIRFLAAALLAAVMLPGGDARAQGDPARQARLVSRMALELPAGPGPFPVVVFSPGCQGFDHARWKDRYEHYGRELMALGFGVARGDYLAAAEASSCDLIMNPEQAAVDLGSVVKAVRARAGVKADAVYLMGWSFGGGTALAALGVLESADPAAMPNGVVAYSPYLALRRPWTTDQSVLILCTGEDVVAPCDRIDALLADVPRRERVRYVRYDEGQHGFDHPGLPTEPTVLSGNRVGYHERSAKAAWAEVVRFLRR